MYNILKIINLILLSILPLNIEAKEIVELNESDHSSNWAFSISLGYGERSNPLLNAEEIKLAVDLSIAWYGEKWFFDNGDLGYTLIDNDFVTLNTVTRINSDRVFFQKTNTQYISIGGALNNDLTIVNSPPEGFEDQFAEFILPKRKYAFETGLELITDGNWGVIQADFFHDISAVHKGLQASFTYSYPYQFKRWYIEPSISTNWKSKKLNNYYWGLTAEESGGFIPAYSADSGFNTQFRFLCSYQINKKWSWVSALDHEKLNSSIVNSPIVDNEKVTAWYTGFRYRF